MFSTPLICSSSGVATVSATVTGLAPGNWAVTCTDGGTTSGYSEMGSSGIAISPARKITAEITPAKIGRSMKNRDRDILSLLALPDLLDYPQADLIARGAAALPLGNDGSAWREPLQVIEDDAVAGFEPGKHDAVAVDLRTERDGAILGLVVVTDNKDKALALIVANGALRH